MYPLGHIPMKGACLVPRTVSVCRFAWSGVWGGNTSPLFDLGHHLRRASEMMSEVSEAAAATKIRNHLFMRSLALPLAPSSPRAERPTSLTTSRGPKYLHVQLVVLSCCSTLSCNAGTKFYSPAPSFIQLSRKTQLSQHALPSQTSG